MSRWIPILLVIPACDGGEPPVCEVEDRATCTSSLRVSFADGRSEFQLRLQDDVDLDVNIRCPDLDPTVENERDGYIWTCTDGGVNISTDKFFGDVLSVQVGQLPAEDFPLQLSLGGDFCGNVCNNASLVLN